MLTLRLTVGGATSLALVFSVSRVSLAQDAESVISAAAGEGVTFSTGTSSLDDILDMGTQVTGPDGVNRRRGLTAALTNRSSDPRLVGDSTLTWNVDQYGGDEPYDGPEWGTVRLENDGGTGQGTYTGFTFPDDEVEWFVAYVATLEGEGDYEGLVSNCHWYVPGRGWNTQTKCVVMPGDLSSFQQSMPEPPAE